MWLLKVYIDGKPHLLHTGDRFIGTQDKSFIEKVAIENCAKIVSCGGYEAVEMNEQQLSDAIGGVPYHILQVSGGLIPFCAVKLIKEIPNDSAS